MTRLFDALAACEVVPLADVDRDPTACKECGEALMDYQTFGVYVPATDLCGVCRWRSTDVFEDDRW